MFSCISKVLIVKPSWMRGGRAGEEGGEVVKGGGGVKGGEMTQTLYVHMNKKKIVKPYLW
jgi:hypothetical protein